MVSRLKLQYCKIVLATSLVWFLLDVVLLMYFTDCATNAATDCSNGKVKEKKSEGGSLLQRILPKEPIAPGDDLPNLVNSDKKSDTKIIAPPKLFNQRTKRPEYDECNGCELYREYSEFPNDGNIRNYCCRKVTDYDSEATRSVEEKMKQLESDVAKQLSDNEQMVKDALKQFEANIGDGIQRIATEAASKIDEMASNVEQRIQVREKEIESRIRLSIREVEGSIKVFEREVEAYMRGVLKNIDETIAVTEKRNKAWINNVIERVEHDVRQVVAGVKSDIEKMVEHLGGDEVKKSITEHIDIDRPVGDKIRKASGFENKLIDNVVKDNKTKLPDSVQLLESANAVSVPTTAERVRMDHHALELKRGDESLHLAISCEKGDNCRQPIWLEEEYHYMYDREYYERKHRETGNYTVGHSGDCVMWGH